jgi:hypothetical protein
MSRLSDLVDALDDADGDPHSLQASLRLKLCTLRSELRYLKVAGGRESMSLSAKLNGTPDKFAAHAVTRASISMQSTPPGRKQFAATVEALKLRDSKLNKAEDTATKFLEASDGYHRIAKKLIDQKVSNSRVWGGNS